jgi:glutaminase
MNFYNTLFTSVHKLLQGSGASSNPNITKGALLICQIALQTIRSEGSLGKLFTGLSSILCKLADENVTLLGTYLI